MVDIADYKVIHAFLHDVEPTRYFVQDVEDEILPYGVLLPHEDDGCGDQEVWFNTEELVKLHEAIGNELDRIRREAEE